MGVVCGAKTRRGGQCQQFPVSGNRRCRYHGGASTGPRTKEGKARVALNGITHGIYLQGYSEEELKQLRQLHQERLKGGWRERMEAELDLTRIQLARAWRAAGEASHADNPEAGLELVEQHITHTSHHAEVEARKAEVIRRRPDMWIVVDRCVRTFVRAFEAYLKGVEQTDILEEIAELRGRLPQFEAHLKAKRH